MFAFLIFSILAAVAHVGFFVLETVLWATPWANAVFRVTAKDAAMMALFARNQGFYNLFLAAGVAAGWYFHEHSVVVFACAVMLGAALALSATAPRMLRGALLQGVPPALALLSWALRS